MANHLPKHLYKRLTRFNCAYNTLLKGDDVYYLHNEILQSSTQKWSITTEYLNRYRHGASIKYYENGSIAKKCYYQYNRLHGTIKEYHLNGNLKSQYNTVNGVVHGVFKSYTTRGQLLEFEEYKKGNLLHTDKLTTPKVLELLKQY